MGTYRVTEDEAWSWRYEAVSMEAAGKRYPGSSVELKLTAAGETVTCINRRREEKWLDGNSYCQNLFKETGVERRAEK